MLEKGRAVALLKALEDVSDVVFGDHTHLLCLGEASGLSPAPSSGIVSTYAKPAQLRTYSFLGLSIEADGMPKTGVTSVTRQGTTKSPLDQHN
jgi:hypothetical protein